jgi:predicted small secreted protein
MLKSFFNLFVVTSVIFIVAGCGTVGGAVSGAGTDLQRAGDWIKSR